MSEELNCTVKGEDFARAVLAVEKSAAKNNGRPVLAGILMEVDAEQMTVTSDRVTVRMTLVAADGFRLSFASLDCGCGTATFGKAKILLPAKPLAAFASKAKKAQKVTISPASDGMWCFRNEKTKEAAIIPAINGTFPDWRQLADQYDVDGMKSMGTFNARYLAEAAATALPNTMVTIRRNPENQNCPGVIVVRDYGDDEVVRHIIMPMVVGTDDNAA